METLERRAMATKNELYREGRQLQNDKKYDEAVSKYQAAVAEADKYALAFHALVQCFTELGRHEEAINAAKRIIELEPDDQFSYIAISRAYQRAGMIPEAEYAMMQGQQAAFRSPPR